MQIHLSALQRQQRAPCLLECVKSQGDSLKNEVGPGYNRIFEVRKGASAVIDRCAQIAEIRIVSTQFQYPSHKRDDRRM
jgi:hypothetical protein